MFSQEELVNIQWDLVIANFKDPKTITLLRDKVEDASFGSSSHRVGVLSAALKKAFEFKRNNRKPPGVMLRCSATYCTAYNNPPSYATIGSDIYCELCYGRWPGRRCFQCAGCGANRLRAYTSCQSCGGMFV